MELLTILSKTRNQNTKIGAVFVPIDFALITNKKPQNNSKNI